MLAIFDLNVKHLKERYLFSSMTHLAFDRADTVSNRIRSFSKLPAIIFSFLSVKQVKDDVRMTSYSILVSIFEFTCSLCIL